MLLICSKTNFEKTNISTKIKMKTKKCAKLLYFFSYVSRYPCYKCKTVLDHVDIWFPKHRKCVIYFGKPSHAVKKRF